MRSLALVFVGASIAALAGCDSLFGVGPHELATDAGTGGGAPGPGGEGGPDASPLAATDAAVEASPGRPVAAALCSDSGVCLGGGIFSVDRVPDEAGSGALPGGGVVTLTDDGFEFGNTMCDPQDSGVCVTGGLTP
jgi:hypothetical protein